VVVTAQRRNQRLEEVPISVTALSSKDLAVANVQGLKDLQTIAPSFQMANSGAFTQLSIRGVTSETLGPGIENNIAVYIDGFYEPDSASLGADFANVSDIQVLKGPQGTLYGRNATGGALLINTTDPSLTHPVINAFASYGNLNDRRFDAYVGVPITPTLAFGVGAHFHANDGYIKNINTNSPAARFSETEIRAKLRWEPTSQFSATLGFNYFDKSDPLLDAFSDQKYSALGLPNGPLFTNQIGYISQNPDPTFTVRQKETTLKARWATDFGTFTDHTSYTDERPFFVGDPDGSLLNLQQFSAQFERHTFVEQVDYDVKPTSTIEIQAGAFYYNDESSDNEIVNVIFPPIQPVFGPFEHPNLALHTNAYAGYVDATWEFLPHVFLNAGVRYSNDKRSVNSYFVSENAVLASFDPIYPVQAPKTTASFPATTPRATLRWEFAPRTDVYFSFSQGFKSGAFNTVGTSVAAIITPVQPEHINAYEVGFKTAGARFHFESAAYYYDYKDLQVQTIGSDPTTGEVLVTYKNAATATIWGLEASGAWAVTPNFNVRAGVAYTHARYGSFPNASVNLPYTNPLTGQTTIINTYPTSGMVPGLPNASAGAPLLEDFSGLRIARAPDWTASIGGDYSIPISVGKIVIAANGYYTSEFAPQSEAYDPVTKKPLYYDNGYFLANASVDWVRDHYKVGVYVNDIGDTRYALHNSSDASGYGLIMSAPRTYGVRISYTY
jgi:iron complex outermembrane receptor protein